MKLEIHRLDGETIFEYVDNQFLSAYDKIPQLIAPRPNRIYKIFNRALSKNHRSKKSIIFALNTQPDVLKVLKEVQSRASEFSVQPLIDAIDEQQQTEQAFAILIRDNPFQGLHSYDQMVCYIIGEYLGLTFIRRQ